MHHLVANLSYIGNCAAAFGERERTTIFLDGIPATFCAIKNWSWSFILGFLFLFFQAKRK